MAKQKFDIYQDVTDRIIESLEKGIKPWNQEWNTSGAGGLPLNLSSIDIHPSLKEGDSQNLYRLGTRQASQLP